jgi:hypothetical protein
LEALEDAINGHDFQVILMRADSHMRGSYQGLLSGESIGNKDLCCIEMEIHFPLSWSIAGRLAAAIDCPT